MAISRKTKLKQTSERAKRGEVASRMSVNAQAWVHQNLTTHRSIPAESGV